MAPKRKRAALADSPAEVVSSIEPPVKAVRKTRKISTNPDVNPDVLDAPNALRASPDVEPDRKITNGHIKEEDQDSPLSDLSDVPVKAKKKATSRKPKASGTTTNGTDTPAAPAPAVKKAAKSTDQDTLDDPEAEDGEEATEEEVNAASRRPPPVHSSYLPLPWKGRLGYACLNTYLRLSNPPVFCSRTCRIASILEHRHPLKDPTQPEHATKNRPDRDQPASIERGQRYLEDVCLANVRDLPKMIRWNDKYGIKFMRLSSEMFPFASHEEYGYNLAPFATDALAEAGKVIAELGHRVTTHPGQFTQLGSPRQSVIENAIRDLVYHDEMLSLLKLPEQQNKDAVMILHMGGVFGDKETAIQRFRENYANLSQSVKNRLVLENDDVSYHVHDLLPVCEELNIPMVLDFHHHNILFDPEHVREGTADVVDLYPRILATWTRKGITPKMHYSEPTPAAITPRQRRKHNPRVSTLPPCPDTMDLMIEAKDKEQAVFQLMRDFKLPGWDTINDLIPYVREDDNKATLAALAKQQTKKAKAAAAATKKRASTDSTAVSVDETASEPDTELALIPDDLVGMGGPHNRVFWPVGMEEWLRPKKRVVVPKTAPGAASASAAGKKPMDIAERKRQLAAAAAAAAANNSDGTTASITTTTKEESPSSESDVNATPATKKAKKSLRAKAKRQQQAAAADAAAVVAAAEDVKIEEEDDVIDDAAAAAGLPKKQGRRAPAKRAVMDAVAVPASESTKPPPPLASKAAKTKGRKPAGAIKGATKGKSAGRGRGRAASLGPDEEDETEEEEAEQDEEDEDMSDVESDMEPDSDVPAHQHHRAQKAVGSGDQGARNSARSSRGQVNYAAQAGSEDEDEEL